MSMYGNEYDYDYGSYANDADDLNIYDEYEDEDYEDDSEVWDNYYHNITDEIADE